MTLDFETVYNQGDEADYWRIVNSYPGTFSYEALKEQDPRYADFRAFKEKGIIYCNMKDTPFTKVCRPSRKSYWPTCCIYSIRTCCPIIRLFIMPDSNKLHE